MTISSIFESLDYTAEAQANWAVLYVYYGQMTYDQVEEVLAFTDYDLVGKYIYS